MFLRSSFNGSAFETFILNIIIIIISTMLKTHAVNPGCECVRYTTTKGKEWGVFGSPDWPLEYPRGIKCLLYSFSAPKGFIVNVQLDNVSLPQYITPSSYNTPNPTTNCVDYLKLFIHVEEAHVSGRGGGGGWGGVNENTPWTTLLCGQFGNISYYSSTRHFIIQFHSAAQLPHPHNIPNSKYSFNGRYRFLNSSQFESSGRMMSGSKCNYQFSGSDEEGRFFSPRYPSTYPHNIQCAYHFYASLHKRVRILFDSVALQPGDNSCLNKTDVIRIIDGSNSNSPVISLICNAVKDYEILSTGPHLQVEFLANSDNPGVGFRAIYQYVQMQLDSSLDNSRLTFSSQLNNGHDGLPQASTLVPQCNQVITSDAGRNGSFSSPNYPHPYSPKTMCRYVFLGHGKERVQITFTDFSLFHPAEEVGASDIGAIPGGLTLNGQLLLYLNGNLINEKSTQSHRKNRGCFGADILSVWIYSDGVLVKMYEFCGHSLPPAIMSNGHRLTLDFIAATSGHVARGFSANYAFLQDLGISGGRQLGDYPCGFMYNSSEWLSGSFSSPNHPGIYPRDTECHYFFHGTSHEHVVLTFTYFHVQGIGKCQELTKSDYVVFSNSMPVDSLYPRLCGHEKEPFRVISQGHFFRVTFRSNGHFDGGGFNANFLFTTQPHLFQDDEVRILQPGEDFSASWDSEHDNMDGYEVPNKAAENSRSFSLSTLVLVGLVMFSLRLCLFSPES